MRLQTILLILGLVLLVAAMEAAEQDLHFKLSMINPSPKTIGTKHEKDEGNNEYIELSHEQSGKLKHIRPILTVDGVRDVRRIFVKGIDGLSKFMNQKKSRLTSRGVIFK